jgi:hypothetical protein
MEHTSGYVQRMHKKELLRNSRYLLQEVKNNTQRVFKNVNYLAQHISVSRASPWVATHSQTGGVPVVELSPWILSECVVSSDSVL